MEENTNTSAVQQPKKKKHVFLKIILILLLIVIIGIPAYIGWCTLSDKYGAVYAESGFSGVFNAIVSGDSSAATKTQPATAAPEAVPAATPSQTAAPEQKPAATSAPAAKNEGTMTAAEVYEKNVGATVAITAQTTVNYWGQSIQSGALGSGFIISEDGYILTNYHVIEGSNNVSVATYDGKEYPAEIIGYDESNDIAILKIEGNNFQAVTLGDSDTLKVGDEVIAIGNPLGELTFSMTKGYVSALARNVTLSPTVSMKLIQTDCAINSGNSGGALFNMKGEVIGITNAKYSSNGNSTQASIEGIGFAIPINSVAEIVESIITNGYIIKPYIGVTVSAISEETATALNIKAGALIRAVTEDGPAAKAGLKENDIIYSVDGKDLEDYSVFVDCIAESDVGDKHTLGIVRAGEKIEIEVTVGEQEKSAKANDQPKQEQVQDSKPQNKPNQGGTEQYQLDPDEAEDWINEFYKYYFGQ